MVARSLRPAHATLLIFGAVAVVTILVSAYNLDALPHFHFDPRYIKTFNPFGPIYRKQWTIPTYPHDEHIFGGHFTEHASWSVPGPWKIETIEELFLNSYTQWREFLERQSKTFEEAVRNYKIGYKRDPPPGFQDWYNYAVAMGAPVIDDYDRIEEDIAPFRTMSPTVIARRIRETLDHDAGRRLESIDFEKGSVNTAARAWGVLDMRPFVHRLPEMKLLYNAWDEPFVIPMENDTKARVEFFGAGKEPWWGRFIEQCRWQEDRGEWVKKEKKKPMYAIKGAEGYINTIEDAKEALDICAHLGDYKDTHGFFIGPTSFTGTKQLVPIFSVQKMSIFRDILLPSWNLYSDKYMGNSGIKPWEGKKKKMFWRGSLTGGVVNGTNFLNAHRVRLPVLGLKFADMIDARLTSYFEWHNKKEALQGLKRLFENAEGAEKSDENDYGYLWDVDGNGQSGRYYRLLRSKAVVFKSTGFQEWHDDRLFPWVHYVPIKLGNEELIEVLAWLIRTERGQEISRRIAQESDWWARTGVRLQDAQVYCYRLMIEYAALLDYDLP
ncbi:hypothetical protein H072_388 [Dactylellina haptotyla CBS 200.50]|uniref:Glycosyl transferase CAP10 domain-containing protein n=1 Tax=Dactylellina haptotyla (strain CBS 200.50) TaxID=1284197 RepID=S8CD63_DACHA|nr:hypothetical protein H072_388 [Dactylellina haptotyla CBS 200.50]